MGENLGVKVDTSHLVATHDRLCREKARLANAKTAKEREFRALQVSQAEKELAGEMRFLGMDDMPMPEMTDDELLAALEG